MKRADVFQRYESLFQSLDSIIFETQKRVTNDSADPYFGANINFLTKSFLISLCCYLEAFLKDLANAYVADVSLRLSSAKIPHNLLMWATSEKLKESELKFTSFELPISSADIDTKLSGNPFKTAECLRLIGVDLKSVPEYENSKALVNSVVSKRNNIVHHNDSAADVSLGDVRLYCSHFRRYIGAINDAFKATGFD